MSATRRLFEIIQTLRSAKRPVTAQHLSNQLEVSVRTIYRDIAELQSQNVPIDGEAGVGYRLRKGYDMPPLMLSPDELEAALLGAQWVAERGDKKLSAGAKSMIDKLNEVIPKHLKQVVNSSVVLAPCLNPPSPDTVDSEQLREAMRSQKKVVIEYVDVNGRVSQRTIWPFMLAYLESAKLTVAWCEQRQGFRHFRTDRIRKLTVLREHSPVPTDQLKRQWWTAEKEKPQVYN